MYHPCQFTLPLPTIIQPTPLQYCLIIWKNDVHICQVSQASIYEGADDWGQGYHCHTSHQVIWSSCPRMEWIWWGKSNLAWFKKSLWRVHLASAWGIVPPALSKRSQMMMMTASTAYSIQVSLSNIHLTATTNYLALQDKVQTSRQVA